jgi:hypothetical protein
MLAKGQQGVQDAQEKLRGVRGKEQDEVLIGIDIKYKTNT